MNIKRFLFILCLLLVIIIAVTGCRSSQPEIEEGKIRFWVSVYYIEFEGIFVASAGIYKELSPNEQIYFEDAEIKINDIELSGRADEDMYLYMARLEGLGTGDEITIKFSHSKVGNLEKNLVIPLPVTGLTLEPDDIEGWLHEGKNVTLSWNDTGADKYTIWVYVYDETDNIISGHGRGGPFEKTCFDLNEDREWFLILYEEGCYVTIDVEAENFYNFSNLNGIFVASSYCENVITNRPDSYEEDGEGQRTFPLLPPFSPYFDTRVYKGL